MGNREATGWRQGGDRETTGKQQETRHSDRISDRKTKAIENAFSNIKKFGLFHRVKSRGGSYEYNGLTYFFLAACVLHNCQI